MKKEIVFSLSLLNDFDNEEMKKLSRLVKLRNIISHEYIDIRWSSINEFISDTKPYYDSFLSTVKAYLEKKMTEDEP